MNPTYIAATKQAEHLRLRFSLKSFQSVDIYDLCDKLEVTVRFVDVNMEGMYFIDENKKHPTIFISNLRPLPRRNFTCGHELGHHLFGHGSKMDALSSTGVEQASYNTEERLVDTFSGALLMPIGGISAEFNRRNIHPDTANVLDFYKISSLFGVGYRTLISHCKVNGLIKDLQMINLLKFTPSKILKKLYPNGEQNTHFKIFDGKSKVGPVDLEVGNYLFLPPDCNVDGDHLSLIDQTNYGNIFCANKPGIVRVFSHERDFGFFTRIQKLGYVGLAEYRHLEND
ncbi:ImmA/IrrE family metallo-endopeptidase [Pedobacter lithocola]|uniref:ImmA/IrrE family metallo-endopeptidase n=1 Tax=Pedobacter lithocola TaxID=1908239 RepID=A0ABV8PFK3_9SPHI